MSSNLARCPGGLVDSNLMEDVLEMYLYLAAAAHDYQHPGLTNDYMIKTHHPLAMRYNDRYVLTCYQILVHSLMLIGFISGVGTMMDI